MTTTTTEALAQALEFYSNPADYKGPLTGGMGKLYFDCGTKAREALAAHRSHPQDAHIKPVAFCALTPNGKIAYFDGKPMVMPGPVGNECHPDPLYATPPDHTAVMRQALEALETCTPGDYSTGHVISPSFDDKAVDAAIATLSDALGEAQP